MPASLLTDLIIMGKIVRKTLFRIRVGLMVAVLPVIAFALLQNETLRDLAWTLGPFKSYRASDYITTDRKSVV